MLQNGMTDHIFFFASTTYGQF